MKLKETIRRILREESEKTPKSKMEKLIEKMGLMSLIHLIGLDNILDTLEITKEELYQKYNPFKKYFKDNFNKNFDTIFEKELIQTIHYLTNTPWNSSYFKEKISKSTDKQIMDIIISTAIDGLHPILFDFDNDDWGVPNAPELLIMLYGDYILEKYVPMLKKIFNL